MESVTSRHVLAWVGLAALLSACGGGMPQEAAPAIRQAAPLATNRDRTSSQMAPAVKASDLLYVSDEGSGDVYIYSYPHEHLVRTVTGFTTPLGECVDKSGDVFVVDSGASLIYEYAHGGTTRIATLKDPGYTPFVCGVDPTNGNLAVTNVYAPSTKPGNVAIYKAAKGRPKAYYADPSMPYPETCAYDTKGNLFVGGYTGVSAKHFRLAEILSGKTTFTNLSLNQALTEGAGMQWDGKYLAIEDESLNVIYRFAIAGKKGTQVGETPLVGASAIAFFWIAGSRVIGADHTAGDVGIWPYPSGGAPLKKLTGFVNPVAVAISSGK